MQNTIDPKLIGAQFKLQDSYTSFDGLARLRHKARVNSDAALAEVAKQFEALFMQMMLKSMRDTSPGDGLFDTEQSRTYRDMFDKQISIQLSEKKGLGLADMIVAQLKGRLPGSPVDTAVKDNKVTAFPLDSNSRLQVSRQLQELKQQVAQKLSDLAGKHAVSGTRTGTAADDVNKSVTPLEFVKSIWSQVQQISRELKINPKGVLAQAILETGWGRHVARTRDGRSANNLFGIKHSKTWKGPSLVATTREKIGVQLKTVKQEFRVYPSPEQSVKDYAQLIKNSPRYEKVLQSGGDLKKFIQAIDESGYATDPDYGRKLMQIINSTTFKDVMKQLVS